MKIGDKVYCHTQIQGSNNWISRGRSYEIVEIGSNHLYIIDNDGDRNIFLFLKKHKNEEKYLYKYFITQQELRKRKIQKLYDSKI